MAAGEDLIATRSTDFASSLVVHASTNTNIARMNTKTHTKAANLRKRGSKYSKRQTEGYR